MSIRLNSEPESYNAGIFIDVVSNDKNKRSLFMLSSNNIVFTFAALFSKCLLLISSFFKFSICIVLCITSSCILFMLDQLHTSIRASVSRIFSRGNSFGTITDGFLNFKECTCAVVSSFVRGFKTDFPFVFFLHDLTPFKPCLFSFFLAVV